jgi:uncharacterized protein
MSEDWSKLQDIDLLADSKAEFELLVPLPQMPRVSREFVRPGNHVEAKLSFAREDDRVVTRVALSGTLALTCQRCMNPMQWPLATQSSAVLVGTEQEADGLPPGTETVLAADRRVRLIDLIEEELLLALPLVPMHEGTAREDATADAAQPVQRPFEQLGELLKRRN